MSKVKPTREELANIISDNLLNNFTAEEIIQQVRIENRKKMKLLMSQENNKAGSIYGQLVDIKTRKKLKEIIEEKSKNDPKIENVSKIVEAVAKGMFSLEKQETSCGKCSKCIKGGKCSYYKRIRIEGEIKTRIIIPKDFNATLVDNGAWG